MPNIKMHISKHRELEMSEYERSVPAGKKFLTGHPLFDRIINLNYGTSILMLDETFSEAQSFYMYSSRITVSTT